MSRRVKSSLFDNPFVMLILGFFLVVYGLHAGGEYRELKSKCNETTSGKISLVYRTGSGKHRRYKADVTFVVNDKEYTFSLRRRKTSYPQNKKVSVRYNSDDPKVSFSPTYPPDKGIGSILIGLLCLGMFVLWLVPKDKLPDLSKLLHKDDGY